LKFRATISFTYEVPDDELDRVYGTHDPAECAAVDAKNNPFDLLDSGLSSDAAFTIEPVF
jgi:hypothetical protein